MACKVLSLNCNGLRNRTKRKSIFTFCKRSKYDIVCLQESFIVEADVEQWTREWHGQLFFIPGTVDSKGQLILIHNKFNISNVNIEKCQDRILVISFTYKDQELAVMNVYAPNDDGQKRIFLNDFEEIVKKYTENYKLIIAGDMNLVLSNELDVISGRPHDKTLVKKFNEILHNADLFDIWRLYDNTKREFKLL